MAAAAAQLNYFQTSPVRGQLEPDTSDHSLGWRYIQCTDTPNQLRVMLPPKTAAMYSRLLDLEVTELGKGGQAHWTRIVEIRHLKDRMIRKCTRLAVPTQQGGAPAGPDSMFRSVTAPPDFRLKEMERWLKGLAPKPRKPAHNSNNDNLNTHSHHSSHDHGHSQRATSPGNLNGGLSSDPDRPPTPPMMHLPGPNAHGTRSSHIYSPDILSPSPGSSPLPQPGNLPPASPDPPHFASLGYVPGADFAGSLGLAPDHPRDHDGYGQSAFVASPEPIPHPYRGSRALSPLPEHPGEAGVFSPFPADGAGGAQGDLPDDGDVLLAPPPPPQPPIPMPEPESAELPSGQRPIPRRRSSLKRKESAGRLSVAGSGRAISWALDMDVPRADLVRRDVEDAAEELNGIRDAYRLQLAAIRDEREGISQALHALHIKEESLRRREEELHQTHQTLEAKELFYRTKVLAALDESKRGLPPPGQMNNHDGMMSM